ncbi:hypothetical protein O1R50_02730 [Glycomyces luteolus]|uniref:Uncharacterized protein n=1 Tax=Glycomyces luteolus TaxID=2670330 RepID=A0A9X3P4G9_9ACTN|nr:hypothetical protein [Glycomyces luteolus]MDA1358518.1 hypothetical protein [Glycomyces luteolus]
MHELEELGVQPDLVVDQPGLERVDPDVGGGQERGQDVVGHVRHEVDPVGRTESLGLLQQRLRIRARGEVDHEGRVQVRLQSERLDHEVQAALRGRPAAVDHQRRRGVQAARGPHVPEALRRRPVLAGRVGARRRIEHDRGRLGEPVRLHQQFGDPRRDRHDRIGIGNVFTLVRDLRDLPLPVPRLHARQELVRVVHHRDLAALGAGAGRGADPDPDHPVVVHVDQVRPQLLDERRERQVEPQRPRVELAPAPVPEHQLPVGRLEPLQPAVRTGLLRLGHAPGLVEPEAQPPHARLRPRTVEQERQAAAEALAALGAQLRAQTPLREVGADDPPALPFGFGLADARVREREADAREALAQRSEARPVLDDAAVGGGSAELEAGGLVAGREADEMDVPTVGGHRRGGLLHARVAVDAVVDQHHDPASGGGPTLVRHLLRSLCRPVCGMRRARPW